MAEVAADKTELRFMRIYVLYFADPFDRLMMQDVAAKPVDSIRWVYDHASILQTVCYLLYQPWLGIIGVNLYTQEL